MNSKEALKEAASGSLRPLYIVAGEEAYLRDEVVAALRKAALGGGLPDFNEDKFSAGEATVSRVLAAARMVPMMANRRFVIVRGIDRWEGSEGDESPLDALAEYAGAPVDSTCVVLVAHKLDGRRKLAGMAKKQGFLVACDPLSDRELPIWMRARASALGHEMNEAVAEFLAELIGSDLSLAKDAVERLSLYVGEKAPITEDAVSAVITRVRTDDAWAVVDAVGSKDFERAIATFRDAFDPRDRGLPLLGAVAWSVRQLAKFDAALEGGARPDQAAKVAGVPPFRAREVQEKSARLAKGEAARWLAILAATDLALKSSRRPADLILEEALARLCS